MKVQTILALASLIAGTQAAGDHTYHYYGDAELAVMSCKGAVFDTASYCEKDKKDKYQCNCKNKAAMGSVINCIYDKLGENNEKGEKWFKRKCEAINVTLTTDQIRAQYQNTTKYLVDPTTVDGFNATEIIDYPVIYNSKRYTLYFRSYKARWRNISDSLYMGGGLLGYWLLIITIGTIYNFLQRVGFVGKYFKSGPTNWIRRNITLPSLMADKKHSEPVKYLKIFEGYAPTRWESIVLFGHFVLFIVFCGVRYTYIEHDTIWKTRDAQAARYPGDRTGILLCFTFQLTYLFAGRNNFLIWLTNWRQSTFYTYHKWISRANFLVTLIHAGAMHMQSTGLGKFHSRIKKDWYHYGIAAAICMAIMIFTAAYRVRKNYYEVFLSIHFVMAIGVLVGSWRHCGQFGFVIPYYFTAGVWGFDRAVRLFRQLAFGIKDAECTVLSDEILKVTIPRNRFWKAYPGAFGYLTYFTPTTFLQSHPFTVVHTSDTHITFYTKIKGGVTSQIHRRLRNQPNATGTIKVTVEGPYGNPFPAHKYDTVLCYTGGTGIAGPYAQVKDLLARGKDQHIKLYWIIKNVKQLSWFHEELLTLKDTAVNVIVHITRPDSFAEKINSSDSADQENEKNSSGDENSSENTGIPSDLDFIEFRYGRPNIEAQVSADIKESKGNVAVITAAHTSVVDDVRFAVGQNLDNCSGRVDYSEQLQVW